MDDVSDSNLIDCWQNGHSNDGAYISSSAMRMASLQDGQLISISLGVLKPENYSDDSATQLKTRLTASRAGFFRQIENFA